jgi:hypothetical protein
MGERFTERKFKAWVDGKREYTDGKEQTLKGFDAFDCKTIPAVTIFGDTDFFSYNPSGKFEQEFTPKYKISVDVKTQYKLSDRGFPSGKTGRLCGIIMEDKYIVADFITNDMAQHMRYAVKNTLKYYRTEEYAEESILEYDPQMERERKYGKKQEYEDENPENEKKRKIKELLKQKMKKKGGMEA